jgi:hypothetical protein
MQAVKEDNKFTRLTITVAIVASIIAGIAALWVTQGNMLASFQAGLALRDNRGPIETPAPHPKAP